MNMLQAPQMGAQGPQMAAQPQVGPGGPAMAPAAPPSPEDMQGALDHTDAVIKGLLSISGKKPGALTKKDVFSAAADMIKGGAFQTPELKQALIGEIAGMPEDEAGIRQAVGSHLLRLGEARQHIMGVMGGAGGGV